MNDILGILAWALVFVGVFVVLFGCFMLVRTQIKRGYSFTGCPYVRRKR